MAKNALQEQLLKAGLVDSKKVKKVNQQQNHAQKTGQTQISDEIRQSLAQAQAEKLAKDQELNQQQHQHLELKTLQANVRQMLQQHALKDTQGDVPYQFMDQGKIKKIYVNQQIYNYLVNGRVWIARLDEQYPLIPQPLGEKILSRMPEVLVVYPKAPDSIKNQPATAQDDDPYAAYVIPDDLMW